MLNRNASATRKMLANMNCSTGVQRRNVRNAPESPDIIGALRRTDATAHRLAAQLRLPATQELVDLSLPSLGHRVVSPLG